MTDSFDPYRKWLGIPAEEQPPHHYRLLGIPLFESDPDVIENAAHRQMGYVRTFQTGKHADLSQKILNELAAAKICLMAADRKAAYDRQLQQQLNEGPPSGAVLIDLAGAETVEAAQIAVVAPPPPVVRPGVDSESRFRLPRSERLPGDSAPPAHSLPTRPGRRRKLILVPLLFGTMGVVAVVVIMALLVVNFRLVKRRDTSTGTSPPDLRKQRDVASSDGTGRTPPAEDEPDSKSRASVGTDVTSGSTKSPARSKSDQSLSAREVRLREQLERVRTALGERDPTRAKTLLIGAGIPLNNESLRREVERLDVLITYSSEFWKAVRTGISKSRPKEGEATFKFRSESPLPPDEYELSFPEGREPELRVNGEACPTSLRQIAPQHAAALAMRGLGSGDPFVRVYVATFLLGDRRGKAEENRRWGQRYWEEAARMSQSPNHFVADEFGLTVPNVPANEDSPNRSAND